MIPFFFLLKTVEYRNQSETIQAIPSTTTDTVKLTDTKYTLRQQIQV